jgi:hypothetical protein
MRLAGNPNPDGYYEPNSFKGPLQDEGFHESPRKISSDADRHDHRDGNDDYRLLPVIRYQARVSWLRASRPPVGFEYGSEQASPPRV